MESQTLPACPRATARRDAAYPYNNTIFLTKIDRPAVAPADGFYHSSV
jgi:hypothetical protein